MPRRNDISTILIIGSGPIVIGQACEFDYSGSQAVRVLRSDGYRVVLVNSNPATIMTDPDLADATYIEPITPQVVEAIIRKERPDALLPTLGGQTALNVTIALAAAGILEAHGVELIGAGLDAIEAAEDRGRFKAVMEEAGIETARSTYVHNLEDGRRAAHDLGYPVIVRPSYILGGGGTGIAHDGAELESIVTAGLDASPVAEVLIEESLVGWKEFELEVMRDGADNAVIVCSIENLDAMGVHTGDSITVAPAMTLSDREYQAMRRDAITCLRAIGVDTGGSNVQFAVDPETGRRIIIEMNPRVSRSSALASKATGFPIAKIAAKLAVGYTLDEIANDITGATPASFEPALDYVVVKVPRFDFDKFPAMDAVLGTSMQSVGEAMAIGRTFPEALQKALRSLETGRHGLNADPAESVNREIDDESLLAALAVPTPWRVFQVAEALRRGTAIDTIAAVTGYDPWFISELDEIVSIRDELEADGPSADAVRRAKRLGFSDAQLGYLWNATLDEVRALRLTSGVTTTFKTVDTCAAEFEAETPYFYSTFEDEDEAKQGDGRSVIVLGSGPNRIGQGIEFDYCCVHAAFALSEAGYEPVMINCNPETVSTDYDTSSRLYFEPLTVEDVLSVVDVENPEAVIVQLGGQTPLGLAAALHTRGVPIAGTQPAAIDRAEDRKQFSELCARLGIPQPAHGTASSLSEALEIADRIGFPALIRPSYVLGGRAMRIVYSTEELSSYLENLEVPTPGGAVDLSEAPLLIDRFLESATEVDVDGVFDGDDLYVAGIMEHVEEAGVHSGDSACIVPPPNLSEDVQDRIIKFTERIARGLGVVGLINIQFAVRDEEVFVLEANPRASRTVPFISKATGVPIAKVATKVMMGERLRDLKDAGVLEASAGSGHVSVKEAVLPWKRFPGQDRVLGPEMRATGEVMGIGSTAGAAYARAMLAAGHEVPEGGALFLSLADREKPRGVELARMFAKLGFKIFATHGTAGHLVRQGIRAIHVDKVGDGVYDPVRLIEDGDIDLIINTPRGGRARGDGRLIRAAATRHDVPCITTVEGGTALARSMIDGSHRIADVTSLQSHLGLAPVAVTTLSSSP